MIRVVIRRSTFDGLAAHLEAAAPTEQGAFLAVAIGRTATGYRLIANDLILPGPGDWESQGPDQLRPSARFVSRAISAAVATHGGLLFVHSHPGPDQPPGLSPIDRRSLATLTGAIAPIIRAPFGVTAVHPDGWAGEVEIAAKRLPIDRVSIVGRTLAFAEVQPPMGHDPRDARQRPMLGPAHSWLRRLIVGIVATGGIGSPLAETVYRMGAAGVVLVDRDVIDDPSGLRRIFGATQADSLATTPPRKVDVVGRHLDQLGLGGEVVRLFGDVRTESIARQLLDCDVLMCGTDTHGSRAVLNDLAVAYGLPLIDVGVQAGIDDNGWLAQLASEVRVVTWDTPCLWDRGTIDGRMIREENLPTDEVERLVGEGYAVGRSGRPEPSSAALTVMAAGQGACALLALLSERGEDAPSAYLLDGLNPFLRIDQLEKPGHGCRCRELVGRGDQAMISLVA